MRYKYVTHRNDNIEIDARAFQHTRGNTNKRNEEIMEKVKATQMIGKWEKL